MFGLFMMSNGKTAKISFENLLTKRVYAIIIMIMIIISERVMEMQRHSKQRDAILENLCKRYDHPTADELYFSLKSSMPALSLATVYRNLAQLENAGKIIRIGSGGTARYDGNTSNHYHLTCLNCGGMFDIFLDDDCGISGKASQAFDGKILSHSILFTGYCSSCNKEDKA